MEGKALPPHFLLFRLQASQPVARKPEQPALRLYSKSDTIEHMGRKERKQNGATRKEHGVPPCGD